MPRDGRRADRVWRQRVGAVPLDQEWPALLDGHLALRGERAKGNRPRSPLIIAEVQEEPFALKRETLFAVDQRSYNDSPGVQMSNFRFYQDRETGDVVIFLTRYGEQSEKEWMLADYYRYRVEMP